jgi:endonuclease YncB( thermonuclease family)
MKRMVMFLVMVFVAAIASAESYRARVTEVHNGNTISVRDLAGGTALVRLEGVEVPGRWRPFAAKSRESLRALVKHKQVTIIPRSRDRYGRMTATVLIDDLDAGLEQIRRGMAWYAHDDADVPAYELAEEEAERAGVGVWSRRR